MMPPAWALGIAYWLHMLATVAWIGGLTALSLLVLPAARRTLDAQVYPRFLADLQRRLDPVGWLSLVLLAGTGMFQMSASPNYAGFLAINNPWAIAILLKHIVFLGMTAVSAYLTWGIMPRIQRLALRQAARRGDPAAAPTEAASLQRQEMVLLRLNLALAVLVLALTALARAS
jgi:uncharacterized membrane protein